MTRAPDKLPPEHELRGLPWFRRMRATATWIVIAFFAISVYTINHDPLLFGIKGLAWTLAVGVYLVIAIFYALAKRRFERRIRARAGKVCTNCGYLLTPELDNKPCPECGKPINLAQARADWIKQFGGWKDFPPP